MNEDSANVSFVDALRSELADRVSAAPRRGGRFRLGSTRSRRWFVPVVTAVSGVLVVAASAAVLVGVGTQAPAGSSPSGAASSGVPLLLVAPEPQSGIRPATAAGQGTLHVRADGCVLVGSSVLVAPSGSTLTDDNRGVEIAGIGRYDFGAHLPALGGMSRTYTTDDLPAAYSGCGAGTYMELWPTR